MPADVESCVPNLQNSVPTHVFTMRTPFVYAWPDGMPRSAHTFGRSAFLIPSRSMRWLPVTFTIRTLYLSATSAMRRSSSGVDAIVNEAGRAVFLVIAAPHHVEHIAQRRLANLAALAIAIDVKYFLYRLEILP